MCFATRDNKKIHIILHTFIQSNPLYTGRKLSVYKFDVAVTKVLDWVIT